MKSIFIKILMEKLKFLISSLMSQFRAKKSVKKGFSLIELLVVVAIIGILAAVAIPAYNKYRINAVQGSLTASLQNIGKGFAACLTLNQWDECDTLAEIDVPCSTCGTPLSNTAKNSWCVAATNMVGGQTFTGCLQSSGNVPTVLGNWPVPCAPISVEYRCISSMYTAPATTCASIGCMASMAAPSGSCSAVGTHSCATGTASDLTTPASLTVTCAAGVCSY